SLDHLGARRSDDVDLSYLVLITEKFGVCDGHPLFVPLRYPGNDSDCTCIWLETKREVDRFPHPQRNRHPRHAPPRLPRLQAVDVSKNNRYAWEYPVTILHRKLKYRRGGRNHNVRPSPPVPTAQSLRDTPPISFLLESLVQHRHAVEVDL